MTTQLLSRVRSIGSCPPSLTADGLSVEEDGFGDAVSRLLDGNDGLSLANNKVIAEGFGATLKMARGPNLIPGALDDRKKNRVLVQRRCILLAIVGATQTRNVALRQILIDGFLVEVKSWLDDILTNSVGGVDLLLHLLTSVSLLPVTKEMVTSSKLGKAVAAVEKHRICSGGQNELAIKKRISRVKEEWSASVKVNKQTAPLKRPLEASSDSSPKKARTDNHGGSKSTSFSNLLQKVSAPGKNLSAAEVARLKAQERDAKLKERLSSLPPPAANASAKEEEINDTKHIKWADMDGGSPLVSQKVQIGSDKPPSEENEKEEPAPVAAAWSDGGKRDRLREKEMLLKARKSKLIDEDDNMNLNTMTTMATASGWQQPKLLPPDIENPPVQVSSSEVAVQTRRMASVLPVSYMTDADVPSNPTPLTDIEQALDMTSQSASVPAAIPWGWDPPAAAAPVQQQGLVTSATVPLVGALTPTVSAPAPAASGATLEMVQSMGLPLFLVGSDVTALQTLAASPSLLNTFVDANGMYDQTRLMALVQTLSQNMTPAQPQSVGQPTVQGMAGMTSFHGGASGGHLGTAPAPSFQSPPQSSTYGPASQQNGSSYRGDQNGSDGNLHISGYGPTTTQHDIITLFSPYVQVDEVVMKGTFAFVNTSDGNGALRAREALNGALLSGSPVRINAAVRRARDPARAESRALQRSQAIRSEAVPLPRGVTGEIDYEKVRDDRGNPATKNLFVAGYGPGTTEQELRDIFGQHATITGVVMKTTFSFVNTSDKIAAVNAREALIGSVINGGVLRINFAKESGRLGTSFDSTYGPSAQQRYSRHPVY
mmetsp:Transcript_3294/g.8525  ORF Transcript_3294/g.8525 Transcript_3294/m.8525 type:complete len:828 (-) Transcript_3294:225-2708(-)|eukprot:CAMPEP_0113585646 /NCGR_PEP_ID=MMETSP0015_2-20120614/33824_1 /TAXON_ID=2838 /ORGANISM="Odontella" /LENGTH=827 /DNA_ID=CAMNT_0000490929 /DNA_START=104 /DNA_END=2587 /DNA_ORIENTATION=+ /assembly_acc=CAM_ASM_000160